MINLYNSFKVLDESKVGTQYPLNNNDKIIAYYGLNTEGNYRISFLSNKKMPITKSTKNIGVVCGESTIGKYWTCFDLLNNNLLSAFSTFGEDLIECVVNRKESEDTIINSIKRRFNTWISLFSRSTQSISKEAAKGLYGELYFISKYLLEKYGANKSINGWSGPEMYSKDFSVDNTWYEIKTVNALSPTVKISSIQQLSSDEEGHFVVIKVEEMSDAYDESDSSINKLCYKILSMIQDGDLKDIFLKKVGELGFTFDDDIGSINFHVEDMSMYLVNHYFPRLKREDLPIAINNASYELIVNFLNAYKEKMI